MEKKTQKKITIGKADLNDMTGVIVGKELLLQLGANIGDKIKVISSENKDIEFTITGAFQSGFYDYDSAMIILPLQSVQIMTESDDIVTEINVKIEDIHSAEKTAEEIKTVSYFYQDRLIVALGISNGLDKNMIQNILSMTTHIKVTNQGVAIEGYDDIAKKIDNVKGVVSAMPQYITQGIVKYSGENRV